MTCQCDFCKRSRRIALARIGLSDEAKQLIDDLHNELVHAELDRDVHKAVIEGTWPGADEIIKHTRTGRSRSRP